MDNRVATTDGIDPRIKAIFDAAPMPPMRNVGSREKQLASANSESASGGGMQTMSCYDGCYPAWGKIIAVRGVAAASRSPAR